MKIFQWIVTILLILYATYSLYSTLKLAREDKRDTQKFMEAHPEAKLYKKSSKQSVIMLLLACFGFAMALSVKYFDIDAKQAVIVQLTYISVGIIFVCLAEEVRLKRKIYVGETNFYCIGNTYKYRNIRNIEKVDGFFKKKNINMSTGESLSLPLALADSIEEAYKNWKITKKKK